MKYRIAMLWPDGLKKALTFSFDDGVMQDLKLISLFRLYGIKGTFNLNSASLGRLEASERNGRIIDFSRVPSEDVAAAYSGFEVAAHTSTHPSLTHLSSISVVEEIVSDRARLEVLVKRPVRGMAYPNGAVNDSVKNIVRACGVSYSRGTDTTGNYSLPADRYDWACSCHHSELEPLIDPFLDDQRRLMLLSVWGHSYEFDITSSWSVIESQLERLGGNDDVWYASNIEVFDYIDAYNSLHWTYAGDVVENPTATDIYFECAGETVRVPAGGALSL